LTECMSQPSRSFILVLQLLSFSQAYEAILVCSK